MENLTTACLPSIMSTTTATSTAVDTEGALALANRYVEAGGNFFDTSNIYNEGRSEMILGSWLKGRKDRAQLVIASKVFFVAGKGPNDTGASRKHILDQIDISLRRLNIDYLDLVPLMVMEEGYRETLDALVNRVELAVCTNRSTSMNTVLDSFGLADYFGCVMTASRVANPKPHPEPLFKVLDHYGIAPGEALFVGDSAVDHQAATAAGVPFVAYKADFPSGARIDRHEEIFALL